MPVVLKNDETAGSRSLSDVGDTYVSSLVPGVTFPLRQIASVEPRWLSETKIVHRNGMRCITVTADLQRGVNAAQMTSRIRQVIDSGLISPPG